MADKISKVTLKVNKQKGNPRAGQSYRTIFKNGKKVHQYLDKDGSVDTAVVVKGAADEAVKRATGKAKNKRVGINRSSWAK